MKIEDLLRPCWQMPSKLEVNKDSIAITAKSYWSCLENNFSNLPNDHQIILLSAYLQLIGYVDLNVNLNDNIIILKYTLPGNIKLSGLALLENHSKVDAQDQDFLIIYTNQSKVSDSDTMLNSKTIRLSLEDMTRFFGLIMIIDLYRRFELTINQVDGLKDWFFNYLSVEYGASLEELSWIEKSWNNFSDLKITKRMPAR